MRGKKDKKKKKKKQSYTTFALVGTTKRNHLLQALEAASVSLTPSQCSWLSSGVLEEGSTEESEEFHEEECHSSS